MDAFFVLESLDFTPSAGPVKSGQNGQNGNCPCVSSLLRTLESNITKKMTNKMKTTCTEQDSDRSDFFVLGSLDLTAGPLS